jgi:UDP-N-acetylmuramate--alanine ligase
VVNSHVPILNELTGRVYTYSLNNTLAHTHGYDVRIENGSYYFTVRSIDLNYYFYELNVGGLHNVENATAAITVASMLGVSQQKIAEALKTFKGNQRRFEYILNKPDLIFIDDYAHHPREIDALLGSVKQLYPAKKITAIFQPHLYSRTKDLVDEFAKSLSAADEIILLDIYPARELPIEGVSSEIILDKIQHSNKLLCSKSQLIERIKSRHFDVVLTIGAGDIDQLIEPIKNALLKS